MIYVDTSVVLAHLLSEDRHPPASLWSQPLISSRILEYELWTRIYACQLSESQHEVARRTLDRIAFVKLDPRVLQRATEPFLINLRTLDAIHIATLCYLIDKGQMIRLATYDQRMLEMAHALGIAIHECG